MQVHGSVHKSLMQCAKTVYRTEGLQAFYLSYPTTLCMTVPFTATQFVAYESISKVMNPTGDYDPFTHCMAGGLAGAFAAGITTPLDVVKTLLQTRGLAESEEIRSVRGLFNAAAIIKRQFGWAGFLRGMRPRIISTMPSTAICWYVFTVSMIVQVCCIDFIIPGRLMRWPRPTSRAFPSKYIPSETPHPPRIPICRLESHLSTQSRPSFLTFVQSLVMREHHIILYSRFSEGDMGFFCILSV
jgi:hypothetical protein